MTADKYKITIAEDNRKEILASVETRIAAALEACGQQAVSHAKQNITAGVPRHADSWYVPTGALRNSLNHMVVDKTCYVGTNQEYAIYNEYGTGLYAEGGNGRKTPWRYKDANGNWHRTKGMSPLHFLKNAVQNHIQEYLQIIKQFFSQT